LWNLNQQRRRANRNFNVRRRLPPKRHSAAYVEGDRSSGARVLNGWVGNSRATPGSCSSFLEVSDRVAIPASRCKAAKNSTRISQIQKKIPRMTTKSLVVIRGIAVQNPRHPR
jgi:aspartyl/asparaginyl-tRNA synthetase